MSNNLREILDLRRDLKSCEVKDVALRWQQTPAAVPHTT